MPTLNDEEFGTITVRRSSRSSHVRISVAPNGTLRASLPLYAPLFMLKRLLTSSRSELRQMIATERPRYDLQPGMQIGKSHTLVVVPIHKLSPRVTRHKQQIIIQLPASMPLDHPDVVSQTRAMIVTALRLEAKSYLPKRLAYLAADMDCQYERVRFSHASGRWGSCSSTGTISLNIALMKLPHELIDYVLIHELCHTKQMNHSSRFWALVAAEDPSYKLHRTTLKSHSPSV
ncbi:MAG: SprT family zinc-dependent metalloprotease [Candidatus Saccharimonadales bacterium]